MNVVDVFIILSKGILTAFLYSLIMFWLVIPAILPFIFITFIPKINRILLKNRSVLYWIIGALISYIFYIMIHLMAFFFKIDIDFASLVLLGAVIFNMYSTIYLLLLKFLSNKKQNDFLNKTEKYCILGLNLIFSLLFYAICRVILEYNLFSEVARFFKEM